MAVDVSGLKRVLDAARKAYEKDWQSFQGFAGATISLNVPFSQKS